MKSNDEWKMELPYSQITVKRPEFAYWQFCRFFRMMAAYMLITGIALNFTIGYLINEVFPEWNVDDYMLFYMLIKVIIEVLFLLPILIAVRVYKRRIQQKNQKMSRQVFEVIKYIIIFGHFALPIGTMLLTNLYGETGIFKVFTSGLCMLICSVFVNMKSMKYISCGYFILPAMILIALGFLQVHTSYFQFDVIGQSKVLTAINYGKGVIYTIYPCIGYMIISRYMESSYVEGREND